MNTIDYLFAEAAVREAQKDLREHKVGAVLVKGTPPTEAELHELLGRLDKDRCVEKGNLLIAAAHGAEFDDTEHAESGLILERLHGIVLRGSTIFVTLEPCKNGQHFTRGGGGRSCADIIADRGIKRVVIGMLDPDPRIYGRGTKHLEMYVPTGSSEHLLVDWFPENLRAACETMSKPWVENRRARWRYDDRFFAAIEATRGDRTRGYPEIALKDCLTIRKCPDIRAGWLLSDIKVQWHEEPFEMPPEYEPLYNLYSKVLRDKKRFYDDRTKIMLCRNPWAVDDSSTLKLDLRQTLYSHVQLYKDIVSATPSRRRDLADQIYAAGHVMPGSRDELIVALDKFPLEHPGEPERLIKTLMSSDERVAVFPHALCFHIVVVTSDSKLLLVRRAPESEYRANTWSCSIEEHMSIKDISTPDACLVNFAKRALFEELGLTESHFTEHDLKMLAVFLETDILNVSLCLMVRLKIGREVLDGIISGNPRTDSEMTAWTYIPYNDEEMMFEILFGAPDRPYHPTARYRLLMALMMKNGERLSR